MYLARKKSGGKYRYLIRESCLEEGIYVKRDLMDLGEDPAGYVRYPGGRSFYIDPRVEDALLAAGVAADQEELEKVFWPFIDPEIKRRCAYARTRRFEKRARPVPSSEFHLFDRRRLHFLRFGQMNQRDLFKISPELFQVLHEKSRDEIEQYFMAEEMRLAPFELKSYVYVIFDLQRHFYKSFAKEMPHALDQDAVDEHFLKDICSLNSDARFWAGMEEKAELRGYLKRYAIMFFDTEYAESRYYDEILQEFIKSKRDFKFPKRKREEAAKEGSFLFGVPEDALAKMSSSELTRLYRKRAREFHPDRGGRQEDFVKLTELYQELKKGG